MKANIIGLILIGIFYGMVGKAQTRISFTGKINRGTGVQTNGIVQIINLNNKVTTIGKINADGTFLVDSTATGRFYIYAIPDPQSGSAYLPTYYLEYLTMNEATIIPSTGNVSGIEINLIPRTVSENGSALLEGRFSYADNNSDDNTELSRNWLNNTYTPTSPIEIFQPPCKNMSVLLYNSSNQIIDYTVTDLEGYYSFKNLAGGNYRIEGQRFGYITEHGGYLDVLPDGISQIRFRMAREPVMTSLKDETGFSNSNFLYPNPFQNKLFIKGQADPMWITNLAGAIIYKNQQFIAEEINTSDWPSGIYLVKSYGIVKKIVKI